MRALVLIDVLSSPTLAAQPSAELQGELDYFRTRGRSVIFVDPASAVISSSALRLARSGELVLQRDVASAWVSVRARLNDTPSKPTAFVLVGNDSGGGIVATAADMVAAGMTVTVPQTCVVSSTDDAKRAMLSLVRAWSGQGTEKLRTDEGTAEPVSNERAVK